MFSSTLQKLVCVLIVLSTAVLAHAQSAPAKEASGVIGGKVTIKGKAAAGIVIGLRTNPRSSGEQVTSYKGTTDINGEYRIGNVQVGNYVVAPLAPSLVDAETSGETRTLIVNKGETIEHIDFALAPGAAITGKVVDADGRPVVEQEVQVFTSSSNRFYEAGGAQTDDRGLYRVYGLKPGTYKVAAGQGEEGGYGNYRTNFFKRTFYPAAVDVAQATAIELSEGGEATGINIMLGRSALSYTASGRIVDGETGQPVANVNYGLVHILPQSHRSSMSIGAVSNSRGEFKLDNLVPGKYAVFIRPGSDSNWRADEVPFEIVDDNVTGLVVQMSKGAMISGTVVVEGTDDKNAREDLRRTMLAVVTGPREDRPSAAWSPIAADGSFGLSGVAGGTAQFHIANSSRFRIVRIERNGVLQAGRGFEIKEGENVGGVRVVLAYGNGTIRGSVELANGTLPPGLRFFVWLRNISEDPATGSSPSLAADVDARGQFVVEGLMPGTYEVGGGVTGRDVPGVARTVKKETVVVTSGSVNTVTVSIEFDPAPARP